LLKWKSLFNKLNAEETTRWDEIQRTFRRNLFSQGNADDPVARVVGQLTSFREGLDQIGVILSQAAQNKRPGALLKVDDPSSVAEFEEASISRDTLHKIWELVAEERKKREAPSD